MERYNDLIFEFTDIKGNRTGLPVTVLVSHEMASYDPRIIVLNDYTVKSENDNMLAVSISDSPVIVEGNIGKLSPGDFNKIVLFIKINQDVLLNYWYYFDIDAFDLISSLKKVI